MPVVGARVLNKEAGRCDLTGVVVSRSYLNDDGQLAPLAALLTGQHETVKHPTYIEEGSSDRLLELLRSLDSMFNEVKDGWAIHSPNRRSVAVVLTVEIRGWFRHRTEFIGVVVRDSKQPRILGKGIRGPRDSEGNFKGHTTLEFD